MPTFSDANVMVEVTPSGNIRVGSVHGGPIVEYRDLTAVLMERPAWLNELSLAKLAAVDRKPLADSQRFIGERPQEMSASHYRALDGTFRRHHIFDDLSRMVVVRGAAMTSLRYAAHQGLLLALPAALASSLGPQFALLATSPAGLQILKSTFKDLGEAYSSVPSPMQFELMRNFGVTQAQMAASLGTNMPRVGGLDRWVAYRHDRDCGIKTVFDGRLLTSTPLTSNLVLHEFAIAPTSLNGMATLARIIGEGANPESHTITGARSTLAFNAERSIFDGISGGPSQMVAQIEANATKYFEGMVLDRQRQFERLTRMAGQSIVRSI